MITPEIIKETARKLRQKYDWIRRNIMGKIKS
jgi:hypothetical protein